jgi:hypothetical protein
MFVINFNKKICDIMGLLENKSQDFTEHLLEVRYSAGHTMEIQ